MNPKPHNKIQTKAKCSEKGCKDKAVAYLRTKLYCNYHYNINKLELIRLEKGSYICQAKTRYGLRCVRKQSKGKLCGVHYKVKQKKEAEEMRSKTRTKLYSWQTKNSK